MALKFLGNNGDKSVRMNFFLGIIDMGSRNETRGEVGKGRG